VTTGLDGLEGCTGSLGFFASPFFSSDIASSFLFLQHFFRERQEVIGKITNRF
jgi:hypothetical protein